MVKKILICGMCLILLLGVCVSAENTTDSQTSTEQTQMPQGGPRGGGRMPQGNPPEGMEMPQGNPPSGMQRPQGTPSEGMELPEGAEPPQGMSEDREVFSGGEQGQIPQENTDNTQTENEQPIAETGENANQPQEQGQNQQGQNAEAMTPPNMDFDGSNMPGGFDRNNMQAEAEPMTFMGFVKEYQTPIISVVLLLFAFVFVKLYRRKNY